MVGGNAAHTNFSPWTAGREGPSCGVDGSPSGVTSATAVGEGTFGVLYAMSTMTSLMGWDQQQVTVKRAQS